MARIVAISNLARGVGKTTPGFGRVCASGRDFEELVGRQTIALPRNVRPAGGPSHRLATVHPHSPSTEVRARCVRADESMARRSPGRHEEAP